MKEIVGIFLFLFWAVVATVDGATGDTLLPTLVRMAKVLGFSYPEIQGVGLWLSLPIMGIILLIFSFWKERR